jgi:lipopolysaccharide transport system permease protein
MALVSLSRIGRRYRELLWETTRRDISERHAGLLFSRFWVIGQPLLVMLVYTFAFTFVFRSRLGPKDTGGMYTAFLLAGLGPWVAFQEAIGRAPTCLVESRSLIKQIVVPVEIIPLKIAASSMLVLAIGLAVSLTVTITVHSANLLWWPLLVVPTISQLFLVAGLVYAISSAALYFPDMRNLVQLGLTIGLFVHPILYAPEMLPRWAEIAFWLSPLSHVIWIIRDCVFGRLDHPASWILAPLLGAIVLSVGYRFFRGLQHGFGDAI